MKKISLLLFAMILSLAAMAQLNPYAYGLSSDWDAKNQTLTVDFKLNAKAKKIEIFAVDRSNNNKTYKIHEIASPGNTLDYSIPIHINGKDKDGTCLPVGKNLTFAVKVDGDARNTPGTPVYTGNRPFSPHGVAVNNCQDSQDFGAVYVTECTNGVSGNATWGWLSDKGKSLLKYDPRLKYEVSYRKNPNFSDRVKKYLEPHRVVVSDDGRIFVSSYNTNSNGKDAVWELNPKTGTYTAVVKHNSTYGERVVAIDVKGTTSTGLYMLVCYYYRPASGNGYGWYVCEYSLGATGSTASLVGVKCQYFTTMDYYKNTLHNAYTNGYFTYTDGFFDVAYGAKNETTVYMGLDYFINFKDGSMDANRTALIYFNAALGTNNMYNYYNCDGHVAGESWGGAGLVTYLDHNGNERIASGRCQTGDGSESDGRIQVYSLNGSNVPSTKAYNPIQTNTRKIINDLAIDCAYNLYAVSFADAANSTSSGTGTLLAVPMPYSGTVTTYCPTSNTDDKEYFQLPAVVELNQDLDTDALQQLNKNHPNDCGCDINVNLVRPLRGGMYNTICLPFDLDVKTLDSNHPYYNATVLAFAGATISTINNESVLELNFVSTNGVINHSTPYLIRPQSDISSGVRFDNITLQPVQAFLASDYLVTNNNINYLGIMGGGTFTFDPNEEIVLVLVNDNRLAQLSSGGTIKGFRGFFYFQKSVISEGTVVRLAERKDTPTSLIDAQVKTIDIQKFLRDGRVYIRVGESLYNMDGVKVE